MILLLLASVLAGVSADCDACVEGRCYTKTTLVRGLYIPDQMAIDRKNGILYVHSDSEMNTAFLHKDLTIQLVQRQDSFGLAVDEDTQVLYTADSKNVYKYQQDSNLTEIAFTNLKNYQQPNALLYKDCLTYTSKSSNGLYVIIKNEKKYYPHLVNCTISDFVVQLGCDPAKLYFVANNTVYAYNSGSARTIIVVAKKNYVLATDKYNNVYFGDATVNVIYKMDNETNQLVEYAAYKTGSVDKFVFDGNDNIVFYDSSDGSFSLWKSDPFENANCTIEAPHSKYRINEHNNNFIGDSDFEFHSLAKKIF